VIGGGASSQGYGPSPGGPTEYWPGQYRPLPARHELGGLAVAVMILLGISALLGVLPISGALLGLTLLATAVVFVVWFFQARQNAAWSDWRQSLTPAWAIWGWLVPVIFLWFPLMVMLGTWRAGQAEAERTKPALLPVAWWACWLLAWFTGFHHTVTTTYSGTGYQVTSSTYGLFFDQTTASKIFAALAAILLALIVRIVSSGPVGSSRVSGQPGPGQTQWPGPGQPGPAPAPWSGQQWPGQPAPAQWPAPPAQPADQPGQAQPGQAQPGRPEWPNPPA
jgi:Domain of unknown function (DUF4328)